MRFGLSILGGMLVVSACAAPRGVEPTGAEPDRATDRVIVAAPADVDPHQDLTIDPDVVAVPRAPATTVPVTTTTTVVAATTTVPAPTTTTSLPTSPRYAPGPPIAPSAGAGIGIVPPDGTVALTFDDGPFIAWTDEILEVLDRYDVTATFFISTYLLPGNADIIPRIVAAGHSVQTHGDQHIVLTNLSADRVRSELQLSIDKLVAAGAPRPTCFRPPHGMTDATVEQVASELGLTVITWDVNSLDYSLQEPSGVIDRVLAQTTSGSVVLMHDQWAPIHRTTLPAIIPELRARGLEFSPLCTSGTPLGGY